uniref:Uncharacterized protein n=1 Tax=Babesia bovis TaxID=5865 RepID=S6CAM5_BABBO|nr:hypothetical protein [Babesia bovis]
MVADNGIMSSPPFRTSKQSYLLRDRNLIGKGPSGLSIAATCLTIAILASVLYGIIWALEGSVLYEIFGMSMPLVAKISSLLSTLFLFTVLFKSTAMVYILIGSCVMYTMLHVTILSMVIFFYMEYIKETDVLFRLMYYERSTI